MGAVGPEAVEGAVGVHHETPALLVEEMVPSGRDWDQIGQVGTATPTPGLDVVDLAVLEGKVTERTGRIDGPQGPLLGRW